MSNGNSNKDANKDAMESYHAQMDQHDGKRVRFGHAGQNHQPTVNRERYDSFPSSAFAPVNERLDHPEYSLGTSVNNLQPTQAALIDCAQSLQALSAHPYSATTRNHGPGPAFERTHASTWPAPSPIDYPSLASIRNFGHTCPRTSHHSHQVSPASNLMQLHELMRRHQQEERNKQEQQQRLEALRLFQTQVQIPHLFHGPSFLTEGGGHMQSLMPPRHSSGFANLYSPDQLLWNNRTEAGVSQWQDPRVASALPQLLQSRNLAPFVAATSPAAEQLPWNNQTEVGASQWQDPRAVASLPQLRLSQNLVPFVAATAPAADQNQTDVGVSELRDPHAEASLPQLPHSQSPVPFGSAAAPAAELSSSHFPRTAAHPMDSSMLSDHQAYLRKQIEIFQASQADTLARVRGRNKPIKVGQVGIRCRHCAHAPIQLRQIGSTYFPVSLLGFYQAAQNICSSHIQCEKCPELALDVKTEFSRLLAFKSVTSNAGRKYWADRLVSMGLVDTDKGVFVLRDLPSDVTVIPMGTGATSKRKSVAVPTKSILSRS